MGVQRAEFLLYPILPSSQCQAASFGWAVCTDRFQSASKSDMCMVGHLLHTHLVSISVLPPLPSRGSPEKPVLQFSCSGAGGPPCSREPPPGAEGPPRGLPALGITCSPCLRDTGSPVLGSHDPRYSYILITAFEKEELSVKCGGYGKEHKRSAVGCWGRKGKG